MSAVVIAVVLTAPALSADRAAAQPALVVQARQALHRAGAYLSSIATHGGYLWEYTVDLKQRWGEGVATDTQVWVQPPGTPAVGAALLKAWQATGDESLRAAAIAAGDALVWGQLECGGWFYSIDFSPKAEQQFFYRRMRGRTELDVRQLRNYGTLDDNTSQAAISLLIALSRTDGGQRFTEAAERGLKWLLCAQFPNGGWPQVYPPTGRGNGYWNYYTFNDGAINDAVRVMLEAWRAYGEDQYLQAASRAGDFIILSQGRPPQAGWAQQYDMDLKPAWARKFEPPSWCSAVTVRNIKTLMDLYLATGQEKYLKPIASALEWLKASRLDDGRWARFYELGTNKPLYFTKDYKLTYSDADCPTHYSFKGNYGYEGMIARYERLRELGRQKYMEELARRDGPEGKRARARSLTSRVKQIVAAQDAAGRWTRGDRVRMRDFVNNMRALADYVEGYGESKQ